MYCPWACNKSSAFYPSLGLIQELPAKHSNKVKEIPTVEMNPQHWLW